MTGWLQHLPVGAIALLIVASAAIGALIDHLINRRQR